MKKMSDSQLLLAKYQTVFGMKLCINVFSFVNSYNLMQSYKGPFLFDLVLVYEKFGE